MAIDLFTPVVPSSRFHPAFEEIVKRVSDFERRVLAEWTENFIDRDGKIVKEFQTTFDSSFWELYLFAAFKKLGLRCDFTKSRPDFCVVAPKQFSVEAVVSLNATGTPGASGYPLQKRPQSFNEFNRKAMIRLLNSLDAKHKEFLRNYGNLDYVKAKPFVIAVAPFDRPQSHLQVQRVIEAVLYRYYVDEDVYLQADGSAQSVLPEDLKSVNKDTGTELPLGIFCDKRMADISAVIQSTSATWSKVTALSDHPDAIIEAVYENRADGGIIFYKGPNELYHEDILDGLRIYHNPFARHPLDPSLFRCDEIFQATSNGPTSLVPLCPAKRVLACRSSIRLPSGMMAQITPKGAKQQQYWHSVDSARYRDARRSVDS